MTPADRAKSRLAAIGPQPPWWRPFKRRRWRRALKGIIDAFSAELYAEAAAVFEAMIDDFAALFSSCQEGES